MSLFEERALNACGASRLLLTDDDLHASHDRGTAKFTPASPVWHGAPGDGGARVAVAPQRCGIRAPAAGLIRDAIGDLAIAVMVAVSFIAWVAP